MGIFPPESVIRNRSRLWRKGIDDLLPGSFDLLTVTLLWPN